MLSIFEAENRHLDKHTEPQLKKGALIKKNVYEMSQSVAYARRAESL